SGDHASDRQGPAAPVRVSHHRWSIGSAMAQIDMPVGAPERGAALVELAMVLPLLLVVIAGIVDFGFAFQRYEVITNAAREGARMATLPGYTDTAVDAYVRQYVQQGLSLSSSAMNTVMPTGSVTVSYADLTLTGVGAGGTDM